MKHLSSLNKYFWKYRWLFLLGIVFIILTNYFRILAPQLTGYVVNEVVHTVQGAKAKPDAATENYSGAVKAIIHYFDSNPANKILLSGITLLVLALISGLFMFLMRQTIIVMSRHIEYDQKNEIYSHYQQLDTAFYKQHATGDLMNRISEDVSRVRMYTGPALMYIINLAAVIILSVYFMVMANGRLTVIALAPLPVLAVTIYFVNNIINKKSERVQALLGDLTTNAQESYSGIRVIKSFVQEKAMLGFFKKNSEEYRKNALGLARVEAIYFPSMGLLIGLSTLITIFAGAMMVIDGQIQVGTLAEFVLYINMLTFPVMAIGWTASMIQRAAASQKRINEFLDTEPAIAGKPGSVQHVLAGNIQFTKVNFTYPDTGIHAVKNFSFSVSKGEKIAIVGRTGCGKSTIAQLLLRMYEPDNGIITYDAVPVNTMNVSSLRSQISYVPQDVFLFSDTVANNIMFGLDDAEQAAIKKAAEQASVHTEIESFEKGYATIIGERGVTLSGGQKQRISIARALLKNPQVVIFDDCLSAVDARTEKEIITNLYNYLQDKTAIIITHRIFSLFNFDKIVVMDEGRIAQTGTHEELLQQKGLYAEMYARQQEHERSAVV